MSSIFKRFLGITLSVIGLLSFFAFAKAQNSTNDFVNLQPQIYVKDLVLDKTAYKAGDTVTGSFIAINGRNFGSQNITYKIFLVGDYNQNGGLYAYEWDNQQFGPVSFNKNEAKTIKFSYKLPLSSEGYSQGKQLGIKVWFFSSNAAPLGWTDTFVTVSGSTIPSLKLIDASINVDGKNFGLQDGPTLYPNKTASLNLTLTNPSSKDISVVPNLTIYSMQSTQTPVSTTIGGSVVLKANITDTVKVTLPSFSDKPGVYIGEVVLKDQNGVARTGVIRFRYIVYGDVVNVSSIISDKTSFKAGDTLGIKMIYTGSPIDITTIGSFATSTVNMADLSVKVFNENDQLVGEYDSKINTTDVNTQLFNINTKVGAKALYATAVFTKDGKQIGYYKSELSSDFSAIKDQSEKQKMYSIFSIVALIIVLFIIGFFLMKRFKIKKNIILPTFLFVLFALFSLPSMTLAATTYTVSFNSQSATTAASPTTKSVVSPATTVGTLPTDPIRTGYLFDGWYTSTGGGGSQFTASTVVTSTRTVYANWTAIYYTVTFDSQGGSSVASKTILQDNAVGTLSTPTRTGYDFNGWSTAANGGGTSFTSANIITANITVYANWTAKSYRLTYDDNGGSGQPAYETHTTDSVFNLSATMPTKTGYGFGGWNTNNTGTGTNYASGASYTMPGVATTLYANWTANYTYTVTFDSQDATTLANPTTRTINSPVTTVLLPTAPTRTDYVFKGWYTAVGGGGSSFTASTVVVHDITVYAMWIGKPGAPTDVTAVAGDRQATVSFTPPVSNGFSPITSYTVTSSGGQTATGTASPITVTGLHNGYSYTFTVKATNSPITGTITGTGTGPASSPSNAVTPIYTFVQSGWTIIGAGNWLVTGWENGGVPNITLSSPLPAGMQYYNAGDTIHIQGSSYMPACSNGSGKDLQVFAKPLRLASDEPDFLSNSEPLGTVDSFYYTYNVIKNSLGGYYNPLDIIKDLLGGKTNTIHFMKIYGGATTGTATCNGVSTEIQICVTDTFAGDYAIPSDTPNGIYRLYILGQNDIGRAGSGSNGTDPAAGNSQVLGYQDIQVGESPVYGSCGSSATTTSSIPTTNLCATGTSTAVTGTGPWSWSCIGSNGGTTAPCTANKTVVVNGSCGSSATTTSSIPTTNLCATGTSTAVTGTGPWSWSCIGSNGGTTAPCTANKSPTDGNSVCPNNIKESGETCDGTDLGGASCTSLGFTGGTLSCNSCSSYNTSSCTSNTGGGRPGTPTSGELGDISGILIQTSSSCGGKVNISWDPYAGASKYILRYVKTGNVDYTSTYVREVSAIADGLTPNTSYSFDVQAVDSSESALTNISTDKIATSSSACGGSGGGISGNYTCLSYQNGVSSPTVLLNSQMYWGTSDIPTNASSVQTKWKIGEYTYTGLNVPMIYTTVGKKTISAMIFGTTTVGTTFSGTCVASTTVIVGNGGFQEI